MSILTDRAPIPTAELEFRRPAGWQPIVADGGLTCALELPRPAGDFASRLTLGFDPEPASESVLRRALAHYRPLDRGVVALAGERAIWLVARYLARERMPVTLVRWCIGDLVVLATVRSDEYDAVVDDLTECVATVAVLR